MSSFLVALRRLRDDRAPAIGLGLLVLVTATVFGVAPRLIERVGDDALRGVVASAGRVQPEHRPRRGRLDPAGPGPETAARMSTQEGDALDGADARVGPAN